MIYLPTSYIRPLHTMHFCSSHQRASTEPPRLPTDPDPPLMDLSSLEGPPIVDSTFIVSPDTTNPRITTPSPTSTHILRSKPLPPRPASTDVIPSQNQNRNRRHERPSDRSTTNGNLRRMPARTPMNNPPEELSPDCDPSFEHDSSLTQSSPRPRQQRPCLPLTWLEDEKQWVVGEAHRPSTRDSRVEHAASSALSPVSPISSCSPCYDMIRRLDEHIAYNNYLYREGVPNHSPAYNAHRFHPGYGTALGNERVARWVAMTQRMDQNSEQV
jgi:hypothetical protein